MYFSSEPQVIVFSASSQTLVGAIYIMYSRQLPWGILISYHKWNEMNFISFTANISFLISNTISFLHSVYFIFSKFCFIHSQHLFHSHTGFISFVATFVSFTHGIYFICSKFYFIHSQHLFHSPMEFISFVATFISFSHGIYFICVDFFVILSWHIHHSKIRKK